ncbi:MAG TPA: hypothetical protein VJ844_11175 [Mucilaginibacter sp.]|nr:hypothetical protein [Mucilaginibacter sp.]
MYFYSNLITFHLLFFNFVGGTGRISEHLTICGEGYWQLSGLTESLSQRGT